MNRRGFLKKLSVLPFFGFLAGAKEKIIIHSKPCDDKFTQLYHYCLRCDEFTPFVGSTSNNSNYIIIYCGICGLDSSNNVFLEDLENR